MNSFPRYINKKEIEYLQAKESLRATILIGIVLEEARLSKEHKSYLQEAIDVITMMNFETYMVYRSRIEPENVGFDSGIRWIAVP